MNYTLKSHVQAIESDALVRASIFLRGIADEVIKIAEPNTPSDTGRMKKDIIRQVTGLKAKIKWGKKYAIYQETTQFKQYTTPGTGPHFAENAINQAIASTNIIAKRSGLI